MTPRAGDSGLVTILKQLVDDSECRTDDKILGILKDQKEKHDKLEEKMEKMETRLGTFESMDHGRTSRVEGMRLVVGLIAALAYGMLMFFAPEVRAGLGLRPEPVHMPHELPGIGRER